MTVVSAIANTDYTTQAALTTTFAETPWPVVYLRVLFILPTSVQQRVPLTEASYKSLKEPGQSKSKRLQTAAFFYHSSFPNGRFLWPNDRRPLLLLVQVKAQRLTRWSSFWYRRNRLVLLFRQVRGGTCRVLGNTIPLNFYWLKLLWKVKLLW